MRTTSSFTSNGRSIRAEIYEPQTLVSEPLGSVIVAHGFDGLSPTGGAGETIRSFARGLAGAGFRVVVPHYLQSTFGGDPTERRGVSAAVFATLGPQRDTWAHVLSDAARFAAKLPHASGRCALAGFSLGGHLAVVEPQFAEAHRFDALVNFYGPMGMLGLGFAFNLGQLPRLQIHHGSRDSFVPPGETHDLHAALLKANKYPSVDYELRWHAGERHAFLNSQAIGQTTAFLKESLTLKRVAGVNVIAKVERFTGGLDWDLAL